MLTALLEHARTCPNIRIHFGARVTDVKFATRAAPQSKVTMSRLGATVAETFDVDMLFACDGYQSTMHKLAVANRAFLASKRGVADSIRQSATTGMRHKGVMLSALPLISAPGAEAQFAQPASLYMIKGECRGRPSNRVFDAMILPVGAPSVRLRLAILVQDGHARLDVSDVDAMYTLWRENVPLLRV